MPSPESDVEPEPDTERAGAGENPLERGIEEHAQDIRARISELEEFLERYDRAEPLQEEVGESPAQKQVVLEAMQDGQIPDHLRDRVKSNEPYNRYFATIFIRELREAIPTWQAADGALEGITALEERLQELQDANNPWSSITDGSAGQWSAASRARTETIQWLLGIHPQQQEAEAEAEAEAEHQESEQDQEQGQQAGPEASTQPAPGHQDE